MIGDEESEVTIGGTVKVDRGVRLTVEGIALVCGPADDATVSCCLFPSGE